MARQTITDWEKDFAEISKFTKSGKVAAEFLDFEQPLLMARMRMARMSALVEGASIALISARVLGE